MGRRRWSPGSSGPRSARRPTRRRADARGRASSATRYLGGLATPDVGALGRQPERPLGLVHPGRPVDPALRPAAGDAGVGGRLRARPRARAPARAGPRRSGSGRWVDRYPQAERAKGYLAGLVGRRPARPAARRRGRPTPTTDCDAEPARGPAPTSSTHVRLVGRAASSTGHQRTSSDSSLTAGSASGGRDGDEPHVEVVHRRRAGRRTSTGVLVEVHRLRVEDAGRRSRTPRCASRSAAAGQRGVAGLAVAAELEPRAAPCACRVSSTWSPVGGEHQRARGEVVGEARRGQSRRRARRGGRRTRSRSALLLGGRARPSGRARRARRRAGVTSSGSSASSGRRVASPAVAVEQLAPAPASKSSSAQLARASAGVLAEAQRVVEVGGGGQQVGVRPDARRGPRCPGGSAASPTAWRRRGAGAAAARGRPGRRRSARPDRRRRGGGGRPPAAWRRPASARRWPGRRPRRPSPRPARAWSRAASARPSGRGSAGGSNSPPSRASCIASGLVGSMPRICSSIAGGVDGDAAAVVRDRGDQVLAQPRHVGEQPLVGGLAQREVEQDVVLGDVEPLGERRDVGGHQRGLAGRAERAGRCRRR